MHEELVSTTVRGIVPGDRLFGSGQLVERISGVVRDHHGRYVRILDVVHPEGGARRVRWNASTTVKVLRTRP